MAELAESDARDEPCAVDKMEHSRRGENYYGAIF